MNIKIAANKKFNNETHTIYINKMVIAIFLCIAPENE